MKKILKILLWLVVAVIVVVDVTLTLYLLNYNKYNVSVIGDKSLLVMKNKIDKFNEGDLVVVTKEKGSEYEKGEYIFFYDTSTKEVVLNYGKINEIEKDEGYETVFTMNNNYLLGEEKLIGKGETAKIYPGVGSVIAVLSSRWVFLLVIIVPITVLFLFQLYLLIQEVKKVRK